MQIERKNKNEIVAVLTPAESQCLSNALNEVRHGFRLPDFDRRISLSRQEAAELHSRILRESPSGGSAIALTSRQLIGLCNALTETLRELGLEEFGTRVGPSFEEGQRLREQIEAAIAQLQSSS